MISTTPEAARVMARVCLSLAAVTAACLIATAAWAQEADAASPAAMYAVTAQSQPAPAAGLARGYRAARLHSHKIVIRRRIAAPLDIRTSHQLLAEAQRYLGSGRFTKLARAWCADAMNAWLARAGLRGTGDGRAISFARYGRATAPKVGAIAVARNHVGIVAGFERGKVLLLSGNHGNRVAYGLYAMNRFIAFREPV